MDFAIIRLLKMTGKIKLILPTVFVLMFFPFAQLQAKFGVLANYKYSKLNLGFTDFDSDRDFAPGVQHGAIGLGILWNDLEVSAAFAIPSTASRIGDFKNRSYSDFVTNYWGDAVLVQLYWQKYTGYYSEFAPTRILDESEVQKGGLNALFPILNKDYTVKTMIGRAKTTDAAGSLIIGGSAFVNSVKSNANLITTDDPAVFNRMYGFQNGTFGNAILVVGGAFTIQAGGFYLTPLVNVGLGLQYRDFNLQKSGASKWYFDFSQFQVSVMSGYNSEKFFARLLIDYHSSHTNLHDFVGYDTGAYRIFFITTQIEFSTGIYF